MAIARRKLVAFFFTALTLAALLVFAPTAGPNPVSQAQAGQCTTVNGSLWCGRVYNSGNQWLTLIPNWGGALGVSIAPGQYSTGIYRDTDGYYIRSGQCVLGSGGTAVRGPLRVKIVDSPGTYHIFPFAC